MFCLLSPLTYLKNTPSLRSRQKFSRHQYAFFLRYLCRQHPNLWLDFFLLIMIDIYMFSWIIVSRFFENLLQSWNWRRFHPHTVFTKFNVFLKVIWLILKSFEGMVNCFIAPKRSSLMRILYDWRKLINNLWVSCCTHKSFKKICRFCNCSYHL